MVGAPEASKKGVAAWPGRQLWPATPNPMAKTLGFLGIGAPNIWIAKNVFLNIYCFLTAFGAISIFKKFEKLKNLKKHYPPPWEVQCLLLLELQRPPNEPGLKVFSFQTETEAPEASKWANPSNVQFPETN